MNPPLRPVPYPPARVAKASACPQRRSFVAAALAFAASNGALAQGLRWGQAPDEFGTAVLKGAGSTFAHPLMSRWAQEYRRHRTGGAAFDGGGGGLDDAIGGVALDYEAVGSQAGIQRVKMGAVDFAVSEMPLAAAELRRSGLLQVPLAFGAVAVVARLGDDVSQPLHLSGQLLADIFLGRIRQWSDPAIAALNPARELPPLPIRVVHRADGSGTTYTYTAFLAQASAEWQQQVGRDLLVNWPVGEAFKGSDGVARALGQAPGAIGYLNHVQARAEGLPVVSVQNPAGGFIAPTAASVQAALAGASWNEPESFDKLFVSTPGAQSYPIVASIYGLLSTQSSGTRLRLAREFLDWSLTAGGKSAEALGYVALPQAAVVKVRSLLGSAG